MKACKQYADVDNGIYLIDNEDLLRWDENIDSEKLLQIL